MENINQCICVTKSIQLSLVSEYWYVFLTMYRTITCEIVPGSPLPLSIIIQVMKPASQVTCICNLSKGINGILQTSVLSKSHSLKCIYLLPEDYLLVALLS